MDNNEINPNNQFKNLKPIDASKLEPYIPPEQALPTEPQEIAKTTPDVQTDNATETTKAPKRPPKRFKPLVIGVITILGCPLLLALIDLAGKKANVCSEGFGCAFATLSLLFVLSPLFCYGFFLFLIGIFYAVKNNPKRQFEYKGRSPYLLAVFPTAAIILLGIIVFIFFMSDEGFLLLFGLGLFGIIYLISGIYAILFTRLTYLLAGIISLFF